MEIRFLTSEDIGAYRELRLQALQESPTAFGSRACHQLSQITAAAR